MEKELQSERIKARYKDCAILIISLLLVFMITSVLFLFTIAFPKNGLITETNENGEEISCFYYKNEKQYGFHVVNNYMRYFDPEDGHMVTGKCIIDGKEYFFNLTTGSMTINNTVKFDDGTSVYYNRNGNPKSPTEPGLFTELDGTLALNGTNGKLAGWRMVDSNIYYFQKTTGRMLKNETAYIDGKNYIFDENGQATEVSE